MSTPRDFFQALHHAFDATLSAHRASPQLVDSLLGQAFDCFHGNVAIQCEDEPPLACTRGCASCCALRVVTTAPEVLLVARLLRAVAPGLAGRGIDLIGAVREADLKTAGLGEHARMRLRLMCPYIARGICVIYNVRPLACRGHASHDLKACVAATSGKIVQVPHSEGHRRVRALVQNAMQSSLRDAGLAWGMYELNRGVLLALDNPDSEGAWLRGEDPLAGAAVHDVPAAEMAAAFDQLR